MFHHCIFCNADLGKNEALERFPVGRRIAYDEKTGRLWAICRACERWSLSPIETRWEAIEDAERLFRATALRVSSDNIGLAQTVEGLELIRIGAPPKTELAAWRYGDQFGRRRRRHLIFGGGVLATMAGVTAMGLTTASGLGLLVAAASTLGLTNGVIAMYERGAPVTLFLRGEQGRPLLLNGQDARMVALIPDPDEWRLEVPFRMQIGKPGQGAVAVSPQPALLTGPAALDALSRLLPYLNRAGGSKRRVDDAIDVIAGARSVDHMIRIAAINTEARKTHFKVPEGKSNVGVLPARLRLALEMALHEDDERRAMEGELARLEARWREADAIAHIADDMFLPAEVERELQAMRHETDQRP